MRLSVRQRTTPELPGLIGTARVGRRTPSLLPRLRPGDIAVVDELDLDRATASALVDAGVAAVVNVQPMISGRFPNLGPELLAEAGVGLVDGIGADALSAVPDGRAVRLLDGELLAGEQVVASGRVVDADTIRDEMAQARNQMVAQLDSFVHNASEFLRREEDLLLHGGGLPTLHTRLTDRVGVVVAPAPENAAELARITRFAKEQDAVLVGVNRGADAIVKAGLKPAVVVLDDAEALPAAATLRGAADVVVRTDSGAVSGLVESVERLGVRPRSLRTSATAEDAALLLADAAGARALVTVGMPATLEEFLDRRRPGLASTYLTRLKVGPRLVDSAVVPQLYSGRVRPWHVFVVLLAGLVAVAAAVAVTPVGQQWLHDLQPAVESLVNDLQGLFP